MYIRKYVLPEYVDTKLENYFHVDPETLLHPQASTKQRIGNILGYKEYIDDLTEVGTFDFDEIIIQVHYLDTDDVQKMHIVCPQILLKTHDLCIQLHTITKNPKKIENKQKRFKDVITDLYILQLNLRQQDTLPKYIFGISYLSTYLGKLGFDISDISVDVAKTTRAYTTLQQYIDQKDHTIEDIKISYIDIQTFLGIDFHQYRHIQALDIVDILTTEHEGSST